MIDSVLLQCPSVSYSSAFQCPIAVTLYVLQKCLPVSYSSVPQCTIAVFASDLLQCPTMSYSSVCQCPISMPPCPTLVFASDLLQCLYIFYSSGYQCAIAVSLSLSYINACQSKFAVSPSVLLKCFPVSKYSVSLNPTAVFASALFQCVSMSFRSVCQGTITKLFLFLRQ